VSLTDGIIAAYTPQRNGTGYTVLDRSGRGAHLQWTSPAVTNWRPHSGFVYPNTTDSGDFIAAPQAIPATVIQWSVIHWVRANTYASSANSIDGNRAVYASGNVGPRLEFTTSATWVYSANTTSGGVTTTHACGSSLPAAGTWLMLAITHDGSTTSTTYQQGLPSGLSQTNLSGASGGFVGSFRAFRLGQGSADAGRGWDGLIGATIVFARQLAAAEIWQVYQAGPAGEWISRQTPRRVYGFVPAGFKAYWARRNSQIIGGGV
jgi:hypothetical protein